MNRPIKPIQKQRGAVAIVVGITIALLIMMIGLVVDLGFLYTRKTELQNAADAAALAGSRELNGTAAGITAAASQAIALAAANNVDFAGNSISISNSEIQFGPSPDGPWDDVGTSQAVPANKNFIKVDTSGIAQGSHPTWFIRIAGFGSTTTYGRAVAGRNVCEAMPIFTCVRTGGAAPSYGFIKGSSYRLAPPTGSGTALAPGNVGWMDPVPPGAPSLIAGTNEMREVLCRGKGYCLSTGTYTSLAQPALPETMDAINTRFGVYPPPINDAEHKLACPADTNIKQYVFDATSTGAPRDWLSTAPLDKQGLEGSENVVSGSPKIVHWSANRPNVGSIPTVTAAYPAAGTGRAGEFSGTPYGQTSGNYFQAPPAILGGDPVGKEPGRRVITLGIADNCGTITGSGKPVNVVAFARFFMQRDGVGTGAPADRGFYGEFIEMVNSTPTSVPENKLYR